MGWRLVQPPIVHTGRRLELPAFFPPGVDAHRNQMAPCAAVCFFFQGALPPSETAWRLELLVCFFIGGAFGLPRETRQRLELLSLFVAFCFLMLASCERSEQKQKHSQRQELRLFLFGGWELSGSHYSWNTVIVDFRLM